MIEARDKEYRSNGTLTRGKMHRCTAEVFVIEGKLPVPPILLQIAIRLLYGERRWTNERGGDRDEREAESREDTSGRQLRHRQEGPRRTDVQVHRQQASAQCVPALQPPEKYDQGRSRQPGVIIGCNARVFVP